MSIRDGSQSGLSISMFLSRIDSLKCSEDNRIFDGRLLSCVDYTYSRMSAEYQHIFW